VIGFFAVFGGRQLQAWQQERARRRAEIAAHIAELERALGMDMDRPS
jgi:hypothetical protein